MNRFTHSDPTYPLFPIFAFLGFSLPLIPLHWHFQAWNSGTCWYIFWASLSCLNQFVNSIVWAGNTLNSAPWWCEISIRIMMGASVGLPAASLCINRRLYHIASVRAVVITKAEKARAVLIDSLICGLFPTVYIALQYIVQGHRFNIFEDIGCYPDLYNTLPTYFISSMWPLVIGLVSGVYCVLSLRAFAARRAAFAQLMSTHPALTPARYLRLSALALTDLLLTTPLAIFTIYLNATATPIAPWISWSDTHFNFGRIEQIPHFLWAADTQSRIAVELTRWASPACGLAFFAFFGFGEEARRHYGLVVNAVGMAFWKGVGCLGVRRPTAGILATKATSSAKVIGYTYTKPPSTSKPLDISLPVYSRSATGSFSVASFEADLKRAASFASTSASASTSRFVERFLVPDPVGEDVSVSSVYSADGHVDAHASMASTGFHTSMPETPASATSFASSSSSAPTTPGYALPLHLGWAERPYDAYRAQSPSLSQHAHGEGEEEGQWSPAPDAHSIQMAEFQQDAGARGRALA